MGQTTPITRRVFAVSLRSASGETWTREVLSVKVKAECDASAAMAAKMQAVRQFSDRPAGSWYTERVDAI